MTRPAVVMLLLALTALVGCSSAPDRNNPYDPGSPDYRDSGTLEVRVLDLENHPLPGALVQVEGSTVSAVSDSSGLATLDLPVGSVEVIVSREGYSAKTRSGDIQLRDTTELTFLLNGLPVIDSIRVNTGMAQDDSDESIFYYLYEVTAKVHDPDGVRKIERVSLYEPDSTTALLLAAVDDNGTFRLTRNLGYFLQEMNDRIGRPMRLVVTDDQGDSTESDCSIRNFLFYRWLKEQMVNSAPYSSVNPVFEWENPTLDPEWDFWFTPDRFKVEIFLQSQTSSLEDTLLQFESTSVDTFRYQYPGTLQPSGTDFKWRLTMYDPFGNWTRSKKINFTPL